MTPIPFALPSGRILPPTTAYATGLVCELRPDLADGVRSAVLGDAALTALDVMTLARVEAADEQGANALSYLREIVHYGGNDPKALHRLADVLGLIIWRTLGMAIFTQDGEERMITTMLGDVWTVGNGYTVCGLGGAWASPGQAEDGAALLLRWLREGPDLRLPKPILPGEHEALRRLIPLHAHTVSLDAKVRAAWAKAHLDALAEPVRPMSHVTRPSHLIGALMSDPVLKPPAEAQAYIVELEAKIASNVADLVARDMRIAELERDLACKDDAVKTAHAALAQVSDLLGSPPPVVPDDAVEAVKMHLARRPQPAPVVLTDALDDAGAPKVYHLEDGTERPIPDPERIRLLGERIHTLRAQVREAADATNYLNALIEAHNALDGLRAPRLADWCVLSLAARVRSLPR